MFVMPMVGSRKGPARRRQKRHRQHGGPQFFHSHEFNLLTRNAAKSQPG
jgi:hypothetical protein